MEEFSKLPFAQKVAILFAVLGLVGFLLWFSLISPVEEEIASKQKNAQRARADLDAEKKNYEAALAAIGGNANVDVAVEEQKLADEKLVFEAMLPRSEELVDFITGISDVARASGLTLLEFEKGKVEQMNYYNQVAINMRVEGSYRAFVGFIRQVAEKDRRVVNIRDLKIDIKAPKVDPLMAKYVNQRKAKMSADDPRKGKEINPLQLRHDRVRAYEEATEKGASMSASFTAYVFVYTGQELSGEAAQALAQKEASALAKRRAYFGVAKR